MEIPTRPIDEITTKRAYLQMLYSGHIQCQVEDTLADGPFASAWVRYRSCWVVLEDVSYEWAWLYHRLEDHQRAGHGTGLSS